MGRRLCVVSRGSHPHFVHGRDVQSRCMSIITRAVVSLLKEPSCGQAYGVVFGTCFGVVILDGSS